MLQKLQSCCGSELLRTIVDYCVNAYYGSSSPKVEWFNAYCEFVSVVTEALVNSEVK